MEEQKATNNPNEKSESKKEVKKASKNQKSGFSEVVADHKAEFKKIIWPKRDELGKRTVTVIVTSLLIGAIIFCMDSVYTVALNAVIGLLG